MRLLKKRKAKKQILYGRSPLLHSQRRSRSSGGIRNLKLPDAAKVKKIGILLTTLLIIGGLSYLVFFSGKLNIQEVQIYKDNNLDANNPLKNYFNNLQGQSIVFADLQEITTKILNDNPQIDNLVIKKRFPGTIKVEYNEFPIMANILLSAENVQHKYLMNSQGQIAKKDVENPNLPYIKMGSEKALKNQDQAIDPEKLRYILDSSKAFEEKFGIKVFDTTYLKEAREVHLRTEKYFSVWLDMTQSYDKQFSKLKKALINLDIYNSPLEYIDLRISGSNGEKVIFKRKKE